MEPAGGEDNELFDGQQRTCKMIKWLRLQRVRLCGRATKRQTVLPTRAQHNSVRRQRRIKWRAVCVVLVVLAFAAYLHIMQGQGNTAGPHNSSFMPATAGTGPVATRCGGDVKTIECGYNVSEKSLCRAAWSSRMLSRFTGAATRPWSSSATFRSSNTFRVLQHGWSDPTFMSASAWIATRQQLIAAVLLSHSDVVALQGLEHEQVMWLKDAFDVHGYKGIARGGYGNASGAEKLQVAIFWKKQHVLVSSHHVILRESGSAQGAQIVLLNATALLRGKQTPYLVRIASALVLQSSSPSEQVSVLSHVLSQLAAATAASGIGEAKSVASEATTIICGTLTFAPNSPAVRLMRGQLLEQSQPTAYLPAVPTHDLDLDCVSDVITGREDADFVAGVKSGSVWYVPGTLQALQSLVLPNISSSTIAMDGCVPFLVDFAVQFDRVRRVRKHRMPAHDAEEGRADVVGNKSAVFLRELASTRAVCINIDEIFRASTTGDSQMLDTADYDGLRHMSRCVTSHQHIDGTSHTHEAAMTTDMQRGKTVAEQLLVLTDLLVSENVSRRQVRKCVKAWNPPRVPRALAALVKVLADTGKRVYLKSDGLYELTRQVAQQLEVPDPHVSGNSLTFSSSGAVTGVVSFSQGIYSYQANSPAAAVAKVREHKVALKNAKYLIIGGTAGDVAARAASASTSARGADVLIALNRRNSSVSSAAARGRQGKVNASLSSVTDRNDKADWIAKGVGESWACVQCSRWLAAADACCTGRASVVCLLSTHSDLAHDSILSEHGWSSADMASYLRPRPRRNHTRVSTGSHDEQADN